MKAIRQLTQTKGRNYRMDIDNVKTIQVKTKCMSSPTMTLSKDTTHANGEGNQ